MKKYPYDSVPEQERIDAEPEAKRIGQGIVDKFEQEKASGKTVTDIMNDNTLREERNQIEMHNRSTHNSTKLRMYGSEEHNTVMVEFADKQGNVADEIVSSNTPPEITERTVYYETMEPLTAEIPNASEFDNNSSVDSAIGQSPGAIYHSPSPSDPSEGSNDEMDEGSSDYSGSDNVPGSIQEEVQETSDQSSNNSNAMEINNPSAPDNKKKSSDSAESVESKVEEATSSRKRKRDDDSDEDNADSGPSKRVNTEDYLMDQGSDLFDLSGE